MFELDHQLAQNIVDRAMAILPYNVNVMDSQGLILGSGERNRINTRHEGAQLVLANHRVVEIDEQAARNLKGVQAGINLPLMHDERLIGVLGITGNPDQLRTFSELVRMTAEMLVAQSHMQVEQHWRRQRCDDLLAALLGETGSSPRLIDEAQQLGLKPQLFRTPHLIELAPTQTSSALGDWIRARFPDSWCLSYSQSSMMWCCPSNLTVAPSLLKERLEAQDWKVLRIASGVQADDINRLRLGCRRVVELLAYGQAVLPHKALLAIEQHRLPALLWGYRKDHGVAELLAPIQMIQDKDSSGQLMRTLRRWCEHYGQPQLCAEILGIHRNSLRYRLERIIELSGKDLTRLDDLMELYLGVTLVPCDEPG